MKILILLILLLLNSNIMFCADTLINVGSTFYFKSTTVPVVFEWSTRYGMIKSVDSVLPNNVFKVSVKYLFINEKPRYSEEYWLFENRKHFSSFSPTIFALINPTYNFTIQNDTSYNNKGWSVSYNYLSKILFNGDTLPAQLHNEFISGTFQGTTTSQEYSFYSTENVGVYKYSYLYRNGGYVEGDNYDLVGIFANGIIIGDTSLTLTEVKHRNDQPHTFTLLQNYPNPFNPTTKILFSIPQKGYAILKIYDGLGREVTTLVDEILEPGNYEKIFTGTHLASGVYYYALDIGTNIQRKKMLLLK